MKRWPTKPLGDYITKKRSSIDPSQFPDEAFDLYSIPAFDAGDPEVRTGNEIGSAKQIVESRDVLLSRIVPHIRRAWVVGTNRSRRMIASGEWIVFRGPQLHPRFLRYFLVGPISCSVLQCDVWSAIRTRAVEAVKSATDPIPVPPLAEQERIVKLLDEADDLRKLRAQADRRATALIPALFYEMFGDPGESEVLATRRLCSANQRTVGKSNPRTKRGGVHCLQNIGVGCCVGNAEPTLTRTLRFVAQALVQPGDVTCRHAWRPGPSCCFAAGNPWL